jgi:hypothetical protein
LRALRALRTLRVRGPDKKLQRAKFGPRALCYARLLSSIHLMNSSYQVSQLQPRDAQGLHFTSTDMREVIHTSGLTPETHVHDAAPILHVVVGKPVQVTISPFVFLPTVLHLGSISPNFFRPAKIRQRAAVDKKNYHSISPTFCLKLCSLICQFYKLKFTESMYAKIGVEYFGSKVGRKC